MAQIPSSHKCGPGDIQVTRLKGTHLLSERTEGHQVRKQRPLWADLQDEGQEGALGLRSLKVLSTRRPRRKYG